MGHKDRSGWGSDHQPSGDFLMSFAAELAAFDAKIRTRQKRIFFGTANAMHRSIVFGSTVTGSPGQPVDQGDLKNSWHAEHLSEFLFATSTPIRYAPPIEEGRSFVTGKRLTLRSAKGGFHSVMRTRDQFQKLVDAVVKKVLA